MLTLRRVTNKYALQSWRKIPPPSLLLVCAHTDILVPLPHTEALALTEQRMRGECDDVVALTEGVSLLIPRRRMARIMCSRSGSGWGVEVCLSCCGVPSGGWSCWNQLEITAPPPSGCACRGAQGGGGSRG